MRNASRKFLFAALVGALAVPSAVGQGVNGFLHDYPTTTRIADPKLEHGGVRVDYRLDASPRLSHHEAWQVATRFRHLARRRRGSGTPSAAGRRRPAAGRDPGRPRSGSRGVRGGGRKAHPPILRDGCPADQHRR
jgi:hypothetical protein